MKTKALYFVLAILSFAYVTIRAWVVPITYDEAWTYTQFVSNSAYDILLCRPTIANNHILNSLLVKVTTSFSEHVFALRLPNLLSFIIYLYAAYKIATTLFKNSYLGFIFFIALLSNNTLLSFFALSRGYGIGIAFMMACIYYLLRFAESKSIKYAHLSMLLIVIGSYASFVLLNFSLVLIAYIAILIYRTTKIKTKKTGLKYIAKHIAPYAIAIFYIILFPFLKMGMANQLFYGGESGFIVDTIGTLLADYYGLEFVKEHQSIFNYTAVTLICICVINLVIYSYYNRKEFLNKPILLPTIIFLIIVLLINIQFYVLGVHLPVYRTGLYLFPIIILVVFTSLEILSKRTHLLAIVFAICFVVFALVRFSIESNISHTTEWWYDQYTPAVLKDIEEYRSIHNINTESEIYATFPTTRTFTFYINRDYSNNYTLPIYDHNVKMAKSPYEYDFIYVSKEMNLNSYPNIVKVASYGLDNAFTLYYNTKKID